MPDVFISDSPQAPVSTPPEPAKIPHSELQKKKYSGHTHSRLSAFALYPEHIDFETREKGEKIILLLRAHPITNVRWIVITFLMVTVPTIVAAMGVFAGLPAGFDLIVTLAWYLLSMAYALENFLSWYFNVYFVTTHRIIDVDFFNLIYKQVSDANLDRIQDVTYTMGGVVRTVFNYGNLYIQTAGEVTQFEFLGVPSPDKVAKIIQDLLTKDI
jgi:hypothetical protein